MPLTPSRTCARRPLWISLLLIAASAVGVLGMAAAAVAACRPTPTSATVPARAETPPEPGVVDVDPTPFLTWAAQVGDQLDGRARVADLHRP